jgi:uncharacterized membrane protein
MWVREMLANTFVQAGLSLLGLMIVSAVAYFVVVRLRDSSHEDQKTAEDLMKNFEEMRQEGDIDEKEFRNIQLLLQKDQQSLS